jgi:hypothetical protein
MLYVRWQYGQVEGLLAASNVITNVQLRQICSEVQTSGKYIRPVKGHRYSCHYCYYYINNNKNNNRIMFVNNNSDSNKTVYIYVRSKLAQ